MNKRYKKKKYYNNFLMMAIILIIGFLSVGYSAFSEDLVMRDIAVNVRVDANVRVTNFSAMSIENGALSNYEEYNVDNVTSSINLPNSNSSVRYKVEVTNFGNVDMGIFTITGLPSNLVYDVVEYEFKDKICNSSNSCTLGAKKEFYIDVMYIENGFDSNNTTYNLKLDFDFRRIYSVKYEGITNNNYPDSIMHGDTLRVNFTNSVPPKVIPYINGLKSKNYTFSNNEFIMNNVTSDVILKYIDKVYLKRINGEVNDDFHAEEYKTKIKNVEFVDYVDTTDSLVTYDLSEKQDNEIIGWVDSNYNLFIGSDWNIYGKNTSFLFYKMTGVETIEFNNLNTSETTNMSSMFYGCSGLTSLDVSSFSTGNVINMKNMFDSCSSLVNLDVSNFDTSNVTNMSSMFYNCISLVSLDVSNFDTARVTSIASMFNGCRSLTSLDVSNFDTSSVKSTMSYMFSDCRSLVSLDLSNFDTSNITSMNFMFQGCINLTSLDISSFDTSNVTGMYSMFLNCTSLTSLDVSNFDTSKVTTMHNMFYECNNLRELDLSNFNTSKVTTMGYMFYNCMSLEKLDLSNFDTSGVTNMSSMFRHCSSLTSLNISNFDTSDVTNMSSMFSRCSSLTSLDVSSFDTGSVTNMNSMFSSCSGLSSLNVSNFDTGNVTSMNYMFAASSGLQELDLRSFDTVSVIDMNSMFQGCSSLLELDLSSFDTSNVTNVGWMFNGCKNLKSALARTWADANKFNTSSSKPANVIFNSVLAITLTVDNQCYDLVTVEVPEYIDGGLTEIVLLPVEAGKTVESFKLNGEQIVGDRFIAPSESSSVVITDVVLY